MKKINYLYIFLVILPVIDLVTSITSRFYPNLLSLGALIKGIILVIGVYYILFKSASKYRKASLGYLFSFFIFIIGYFVFKSDCLSQEYFFIELNYLVKLSFFPFMFFICLNLFDDYGLKKECIDKVILINLVIYILFITIPTLFKINFSSYSNALYAGSVGWYYSANEISCILLLLFPFIYKLFLKDRLILIILFLFSLYMISIIGTKVTLFGIVIITVLLMLIMLLKAKKSINKIIAIILAVFTLGFMHNNYAMINMHSSYINELNEENSNIEQLKEELKNENKENNNQEKQENKLLKFTLSLLSDRDVYAIYNYRIYCKTFEPSYLLFGMGISNTKRINNEQITKLIEIDFLDIIFHFGLIAFFLVIYPFLFTIVNIIKKKKFNYKILFYLLMIFLLLGVSSLAGHVLLAPAVSLYLSLYLIYIYDELNTFTRKNLNNKKISILAMHLGYGGVENAICNIASNLSSKYEVEIISLYKAKDKIPFALDSKVKITYLLDTISNRQEFKNALKEFNIMKILKEGFKALKIILVKDLLIKKAIINSDDKIIISTRIKYSKLLNEYGNAHTIKIHQEHTYSVSDKYVKKLNKLKNMAYIMPVSKVLYESYQKKIKINLKYIPLALNYYPKDNEVSNLNNYNLIAMGRLEPEKGFTDLIEVLNYLVKENKKIKLNLFGDGSLKEEITSLINKYKLNDNITLWGFKEYDFIKKYLSNSALYVMTSFEESFGLAPLEAMSYGIPCVAYSTAEGVKSIINKKNGFIVNKRDNKEMANVIHDYFNLPKNKKKEYGTEARKISYEYSNDVVKKKWLDFIDSISKK